MSDGPRPWQAPAVPLRRGIPAGKTRVVRVDLFQHEDDLVGDFDSREEALAYADALNAERVDPMEDVYYVYDDQGTYIRGNEDVGGPGVRP